MTMTKTLMGFAVAATLLVGFEPAVMAAPVAATQISAEASVSGSPIAKTTVASRTATRRARHRPAHVGR
jgi:uncharacterized membrane protein (DUF485 family)